ncbi:MAG TPA: cytochrome c [Bryobacteraceae bacterium]|nr:cytochrome c [Bryobacteraceae bacterium]
MTLELPSGRSFGLIACAAGVLVFSGLLNAAEPAGKTSGQPVKQVTFAKDVAPIFQAKCEECHHTGTAAPMSLATYEEVRPWARSIKERVVKRYMPPWHIDKSVGIQEFQNDRSLTDEQIETIARWVDSGSPMGNPKDLPPARQWPSGNEWQLAKQFGQPELVIKSEPYTMPAHGQDVWWKPLNVVPVDEERWVRAVEIRPGTLAGRKITHHAVASLQLDEADTPPAADDDNGMPNPGGILMEWAIGKNYDTYRENAGKLLKPGSQIRWDIHLHAVGEQITDNVELALYLYPKGETPKYKTVLTNFGASPRGSRGLDIAPNSVSVTQAYHVLKQAARLENFQPHMHLRGKAMSMEAILPDGTTELLSYCNNFNFNWMINYIYTDEAAPVLPKGTVIHITAWHDNTSANPNNPDPNQWVGQGDRTVDEMAHAWVNVTYLSDEDYKEWAAKHKAKRTRPTAALTPGISPVAPN